MKFLAIGSAFGAVLVLAVSTSTVGAKDSWTSPAFVQSELNQSTSDQSDRKCTGTKQEIKKCKREKRSQRRGSYD